MMKSRSRARKALRFQDVSRMADFARFSTAGLPSLGFMTDDFARAYRRNRDSTRQLPLDASPIVDPLLKVLEPGPWEGSMSELLSELEESRRESDVHQDATGRPLPRS